MKTSEILARFENLKLHTPEKWESFYEKAKQSYNEKNCNEWESVFGNSFSNKAKFLMENVTTFSEVKKYNEKLLVEMDDVEHTATVQSIFEQLKQFDITPIAYEVRKDSVLLCWYVLPVLRPFNDYGILLPDYMDDFKIDDNRGEA